MTQSTRTISLAELHEKALPPKVTAQSKTGYTNSMKKKKVAEPVNIAKKSLPSWDILLKIDAR